MAELTRLLVFGLARSDGAAALDPLLGGCGSPRLDFCELPGRSEEAFAVLHLQPGPLAQRLAVRLSHASLHGRRLQVWWPAMPWA
jgi:hypothetical protein